MVSVTELLTAPVTLISIAVEPACSVAALIWQLPRREIDRQVSGGIDAACIHGIQGRQRARRRDRGNVHYHGVAVQSAFIAGCRRIVAVIAGILPLVCGVPVCGSLGHRGVTARHGYNTFRIELRSASSWTMPA